MLAKFLERCKSTAARSTLPLYLVKKPTDSRCEMGRAMIMGIENGLLVNLVVHLICEGQCVI